MVLEVLNELIRTETLANVIVDEIFNSLESGQLLHASSIGNGSQKILLNIAAGIKAAGVDEAAGACVGDVKEMAFRDNAARVSASLGTKQNNQCAHEIYEIYLREKGLPLLRAAMLCNQPLCPSINWLCP